MSDVNQIIFRKTIYALAFYLGNLYLNCVLIVIINERLPSQEFPLPDIGFEFLPYRQFAIYLVEFYILFLGITLIIVFCTNQFGGQIARRFCVITGISIFTHAACLVTTQLPVSDVRNYCHERIPANVSNFEFIWELLKRSWHEMFRFGFFNSIIMNNDEQRRNFCGANIDNIRAIHIILSYQFLTTYVKSDRLPIRFLFDKLSLYGCWIAILLIIISRTNYLVDILFAYYICTRTFNIYHTIFMNESFYHSTNGNMFNRFWWWPLLSILCH
ncbi:hypothetical protein BLA29_001103 [Euroglyphus maynei]|uniref:Sphingomyelin synthase-like domain-containing protein n=1 Tax=Euroglyphus maynei TaxID=6958 RepID=A0A1Y3BRV3_EURMA|nr:hypothetical protein BLA29_001103 [Euroglyphus maynei]